MSCNKRDIGRSCRTKLSTGKVASQASVEPLSLITK